MQFRYKYKIIIGFFVILRFVFNPQTILFPDKLHEGDRNIDGHIHIQ
jgi:hypothetical protein